MTYHELPSSRPQSANGGGFLLGLIAGAAVGGGLALLFTPRQGAEMRQELASGAQQAGRRLTEAYGTVAGSARRGAQRVANRLASQQDMIAGLTDSSVTTGQLRERADDVSSALRNAVGEGTYTSAATTSAEADRGATSTTSQDWRSPLS